MALYKTEDQEENGQKEQLPELKEQTVLEVIGFEPRQHFTQPPPRFTEASLVKELEENGIGRPSTYATILSTIRDKGYVELEKGHFKPNELGFIVNDLLVQNFPNIFSVDFTSRMEDNLDRLEADEVDAREVLKGFYNPFKENLDTTSDKMLSIKGVGFPTELKCPECGSRLHVKVGRNGPFLACSGYPDCTYTRDYERDERGQIKPVEQPEEEPTNKVCENCGRPLVKKQGRFGPFLACTGYPECKHTQSLSPKEAGKATGVKCPADDCDGELVERRSRRGKIFYGCSNFPKCNFATWDKPVDEKCPNCGANYMLEKTTKKEGAFLACPNRECGYRKFPND